MVFLFIIGRRPHKVLFQAVQSEQGDEMMTPFVYQAMFPMGEDDTPYRMGNMA